MSEEAKVVDVQTYLVTLQGLIKSVADTNDKRYQLLLQLIEELNQRVKKLEDRIVQTQTEAIAKATAEIVRSMCGGGKE